MSLFIISGSLRLVLDTDQLKLLRMRLQFKLKYFDAGGSFNYGRDPGWKIPGHPIFNPVQNSTKGISAIHIFTLVMHKKYNTYGRALTNNFVMFTF